MPAPVEAPLDVPPASPLALGVTDTSGMDDCVAWPAGAAAWSEGVAGGGAVRGVAGAWGAAGLPGRDTSLSEVEECRYRAALGSPPMCRAPACFTAAGVAARARTLAFAAASIGSGDGAEERRSGWTDAGTGAR